MAKPLRRRRFTIAFLMGVVAILAVWLAYDRDRLRPVRAVEVTFLGPGAMAVGDELVTLRDLTASLKRSRAQRVVLVVEKDIPSAGTIDCVRAISAAGVRDVRYSRQPAGADRKRVEDMLR